MSNIDKQAAAIAAFHTASRKGRPREPRPVTMPSQPTAWDKGADGPANQHGLRVEPATDIDPETGKETANPNGIKRRRRDNWVARYLRGDKITAKQAAAAETLRMASEGMRERDPLAALASVRVRGNHDPEAARTDARRMAELRRLEFGPLRNWAPCRCGRAIGLTWWTVKRIVRAACKARAAGVVA